MSAWGNALIRMFLFVCVPLQCCLPGWILWCRHLCKYLLLCMPPLFPPRVILFTSLLPVSSSWSWDRVPGRIRRAEDLFPRPPRLLWGGTSSFVHFRRHVPEKMRRFSGVKDSPPTPPPKKKIARKFSAWSVCLRYNIWDKSWSYQP